MVVTVTVHGMVTAVMVMDIATGMVMATATDMATRTGIMIIGTMASARSQVVVGAVVGTDME